MGIQAPDGEALKKKLEGLEEKFDPLAMLFTYHPPTEEQKQAYLEIRRTALILARIVDRFCPAGPDRTAAIRKIREAVMTANASIATNNAQYR